ncbi:MAG: hypothetical protein HYZ28_15880 [Myxococcales bacterium]|nr:hypothetical protein [Myxococcales bacterium]
MAIDKLSSVVSAPSSSSVTAGQEKFGKVLEAARSEAPAKPLGPFPQRLGPRHAPQPAVAKTPEQVRPAEAFDRVAAAQRRIDKVLELAQSGKTFTPAELLAMQAQVYRSSQELDLAGKVVEKATSGVKQVLQTQL